VDRACGTNGRENNCNSDFWLANLLERDILEDLDVDGGVILKWTLKK
jgi:hypothetical protein